MPPHGPPCPITIFINYYAAVSAQNGLTTLPAGLSLRDRSCGCVGVACVPTAVAVASAVADLCGHDGMPATRKSSAAVAADDDAGTPSPVAMKGKKPAWVEPTCCMAMVVTGGLSKRHYVVETNEIEWERGEVKTFVRVSKNDEWVLKLVLGDGGQKGGLRRTMLVEMLRSKLIEEAGAAVAGPIMADDPMDQLDKSASVRPPSKRAKICKRAKDKIVAVEMPRYCHLGMNKSSEKINIELMACSTNQLWLNMDSVPWFISYLSAEVRSGGVSHEAEDAIPSNCEVDNLNISWDFQSNDAWVGTWVEGPMKGNTVTVAMSKFNEVKFQQIAAQAGVETSFHNASREDLKTAARQYLLAHCERQLASSRSCGSSPG